MQQLHLVGVTADHDGLIFSARRGAKSGGFTVELDERLLAVIEDALRRQAERGDLDDGDLPTLAGRSGRSQSQLNPREIQSRLRSGYSIEDVADEAGVDEAWVARFAAPILAEQEQVVARALPLLFIKPRLGESAQPLGVAVRWNLADRGLLLRNEEFRSRWSAYQLAESAWVVRFVFINRRREQVAEWVVDIRTGDLIARNRLASDLAYVEPGRKRAPGKLEPPIDSHAAASEEEEPPTTPHSRGGRVKQPRRTTSPRTAVASGAPRRSTSSTRKSTTTAEKATAKKASARRTAVRNAPARKTAAKKTTARKTTARKTAARKTAATKATARKSATKTATARRSPARKATARKATARKTAAKKTAPGSRGVRTPSRRAKPSTPRTSAKKAVPRKATAARTTPTRAPARRAVTKKAAPARRRAPRRAAAATAAISTASARTSARDRRAAARSTPATVARREQVPRPPVARPGAVPPDRAAARSVPPRTPDPTPPSRPREPSFAASGASSPPATDRRPDPARLNRQRESERAEAEAARSARAARRERRERMAPASQNGDGGAPMSRRRMPVPPRGPDVGPTVRPLDPEAAAHRQPAPIAALPTPTAEVDDRTVRVSSSVRPRRALADQRHAAGSAGTASTSRAASPATFATPPEGDGSGVRIMAGRAAPTTPPPDETPDTAGRARRLRRRAR